MDWNQCLWAHGKFPRHPNFSHFWFYQRLNPSQFKSMMLAFSSIRTLRCCWVMPQCSHRITSRSSLVATDKDVLTCYRIIGLLSNASKCSNILLSRTFSKRTRISLRSPDGWTWNTWPDILRKVEGWLLRRVRLAAAICCLCVLRASTVHRLWV